MNKILYLNKEKALLDDLRVSATMSELLLERVSVYGKHLRYSIRLWSTGIIFAGMSYFLTSFSKSVYVQELGRLPFWKMMALSALNLVVFFFITLVSYLVVYNTLKLLVNVRLYAKGMYFNRKSRGYSELFYKYTEGKYSEFYFNNNGTVSKVVVPNFYASMYEVGAYVPVIQQTVVYKNGVSVRLVVECVGSRADSTEDLRLQTSTFHVSNSDEHFLMTQARVDQALERGRKEYEAQRAIDYAIAHQYQISNHGR